MASVTIHSVKKNFGHVPVLHGVDIDIADGSFTVLVGPSGCGKSTLLRMIAGLEQITGGEIRIGDKVVNDMPPKAARHRDGVPELRAVSAHDGARQHGLFAGRWPRSTRRPSTPRSQRAAEILALGALLDRYPRQLSGGQRQRVAMGRAIVRDPQVFLFDEPLSNLDAKLRVAMRSEIKELHLRLKTTSIYVTHDQIEAMTMGDQIVVMRDGRIEQAGAPGAVRPAGQPVRRRLHRLAGHELPAGHRQPQQRFGVGRAEGRHAPALPRVIRRRRPAGRVRHPPRAPRRCRTAAASRPKWS